jgi:hypothetical protein
VRGKERKKCKKLELQHRYKIAAAEEKAEQVAKNSARKAAAEERKEARKTFSTVNETP